MKLTIAVILLASILAIAPEIEATSMAQHNVSRVLLEPESYTSGLDGWQRIESAVFKQDPTMTHNGLVAAQITVEPTAKLNYQQLRYEISKDIAEGDTFTSEAWVKAQDINDGTGAYLALEFVDSSGERTGIAHSKTTRDNGVNGWELLNAEGQAPKGTQAIRLNLILHSHGIAWFAGPKIVRTDRQEAWPDLGDTLRTITVHTNEVVQPDFGGVGFHAFHHSFDMSTQERNEIVYKRWRELRPSFVRMNHDLTWDNKKLDDVADHIRRMKETGTTVYITTWNPPVVKTDRELREYASKVADQLQYLVKTKGLDNIRYYCMTNELSLGEWGKLASNLPLFKKYHQALFDEFKRRNLKIGLLATDASPVEWWNTIEWAAANMDDITAIYGGHHYINDRLPEDERFYPWFLKKTTWGASIAKARNKLFILGEFGSKQDGRTINGVKLDCCAYFDTPREKTMPIQIAEAAIAAINGGIHAMGYWTYMDLPDFPFGPNYQNKWGLFKCSGNNRSTRPIYYAYGLLTRYMRGPATVFRVDAGDPRLRAAAVKIKDDGAITIAVVNRNTKDTNCEIKMDGATASRPFRKYVYDPDNPPFSKYGDLQTPAARITVKNGSLTDTIKAGALALYTTDYDDNPPSPVRGVKVASGANGEFKVAWQPSKEKDLCYYRIYSVNKTNGKTSSLLRIGSTVATEFEASAGGKYRVTAVDTSGNESK